MSEKLLKEKKALLIVAFNDYQDMELRGTKEILKKSGVKIFTASSSLGTARGKFGGELKIDYLINEVKPKNFDTVVFIGGPGAVEYLNSQDAYRIAQEAVGMNKVLAAICMAPQILAKAGVLTGKKATVWNTEYDKSGIETFEDHEVIFSDQPVVVDGKIITANGPDAAADFGREILNALK